MNETQPESAGQKRAGQNQTKQGQEKQTSGFKLSGKKLWEAFKDLAVLFSFIVNIILVLVLLLAIRPLFIAKTQLAEPLLADLDSAFAALGKTNIESVVNIDDTMPVVFTLPLRQETDVILTEAVPLQAPATFYLPAGGGAINGTVSLNLPEGMKLPVKLSMDVPVSTTVPVVMEVPVNIPLAEAGMAPAIDQLRAVFSPVSGALERVPDSPEQFLQP
jgi:hypothetical protein